MRRKRERSATAKAKASPERKQEKIKRTRSKRRKQSTSSGNDSNDEVISVLVSEKVIDPVQSVEQTTKTEGSPEELQDQVWQVKTAKGSGDGGEIQKLKICLTRPPSTPERAERSPRSKRKFTRATSISDSVGVEVLDEKKKGKHRTKRSLCETSDNSEKNNEIQNNDKESDIQTESSVINTVVEVEPAVIITDSSEQSMESNCNEESLEPNVETGSDNEKLESISVKTKLSDENTESSNVKTDSIEERSDSNNETTESVHVESKENDAQSESKTVTAVNEKSVGETEHEVASAELTTTTSAIKESIILNKMTPVESEKEDVQEKQDESESLEMSNSERKRSLSVDKSEILEIHAEDTRVEISDQVPMESHKKDDIGDNNGSTIAQEDKVSNIQEKTKESVVENTEPPQKETNISSNKTDVVANLEKAVDENSKRTCRESSPIHKKKVVLDQPECAQANKKENGQNGSMNIIINRKRRWGSRPNKLSSQKSITISTDVLKEIIPDVKPVEFEEVIEEKKHYKRVEVTEKVERPILPKIVIDNTDNVEQKREQEDPSLENVQVKEASNLASSRKISIVKDSDNLAVIRPPSPARHKQSNILYITNLVRPFTLPQLKNLLQRTGRIVENGFWINRIKSKCFVIYEDEEQAVETRHALHGVTWPVSNPKTLHVDFSTQEDFDETKVKEESEGAQISAIPGTVEDWLREQDLKRERGEVEKPWERKTMREWDVGKNEKGLKIEKEKEKVRGDDRSLEKRRHHSPERSPEPAKKFKKKEEAPAKLLDDLFRKTKTTPCIYWLPLSAETIAVKEEQRRQHMAEYERRMLEFRRTQRRH